MVIADAPSSAEIAAMLFAAGQRAFFRTMAVEQIATIGRRRAAGTGYPP